MYWDAYGFDSPGSGIYVYAKRLYSELVKNNINPTLFTSTPLLDSNDFKKVKSELINKTILNKFKPLWTNDVISKIYTIEKENFQNVIYHGLSNINHPVLKHKSNLKTVVTVHDIIPLIESNSVSKPLGFLWKHYFPRIIKHTNMIVTPSEWTKTELINRYPEITEKIFYINHGRSGWISDVEKTKTTNDINILAVGRFENYKRFEMLFDILRIKNNTKAVFKTDQKGLEFARKNAQDLLSTNKLKVYGYISEDKLKQLFNSADVFVHPSLYEGSDLIAKEALEMKLGLVYTKGHAFDNSMNDSVSVGIEKNESLEAWCHAIDSMQIKTKRNDWQAVLDEYFSSVCTWEQSALKLKKLYKSLI